MSILQLGVFGDSGRRNLIVLFVNIIIFQELKSTFSQSNVEWPWSQAFVKSTGYMGKVQNLNLSTVVMHGNQVYEKQEWQKQGLWSLQGTVGETIRIGCRMINGTTHEKPAQISVSSPPENGHNEICKQRSEPDCWYNFTLDRTVEVVCLWSHRGLGLSFKFRINAITEPVQIQTQSTPLELKLMIYEVGPYIVRNTGQQQLLFNPEWSLKHVELLIQTNISEIQPACSSFLKPSLEGWTTWLQKQVHFRDRMRRDLTGMFGTGLGVLNGIDSEMLANKLATATNDLTKLGQPLQSSLLALGNSQWQVSKVLPNWAKTENQDHNVIIDALSTVQDNVSLAFSYLV
ncbi:uncharacterized protein LOC130266010 [Oenanthe melanoleuca]|uniref:uncharacterized protein LOC130266010 n=1 Tax=Oenanthe melanoleuca TaxID=2939378 RepID=UPI0024C1D8A7|nr:uncharacterized protein LOC130266010 [Oenanthe melanoleuca]